METFKVDVESKEKEEWQKKEVEKVTGRKS